MLSVCQNLNPLTGYRGRRERSWQKIYGNVPGWRDFAHVQRAAWSLTQGHTLFLPENSILITANVQSETGFPSSHQLKSYVASKSRLKLAARCPVSECLPSCIINGNFHFTVIHFHTIVLLYSHSINSICNEK